MFINIVYNLRLNVDDHFIYSIKKKNFLLNKPRDFEENINNMSH